MTTELPYQTATEDRRRPVIGKNAIALLAAIQVRLRPRWIERKCAEGSQGHRPTILLSIILIGYANAQPIYPCSSGPERAESGILALCTASIVTR